MASIFFTINGILHPLPAKLQPTLIRSYPCRPKLRNRIYYPPGYQSGTSLPLYLNIHGGGYAVGDPSNDDEFCASWAKRTGMLVVSLDYRKAPFHAFPVPVYDVAAVAEAVIDDPTLPIDKSSIVIGGFSAGGNLALTACQLPGLKGVIKAAIAYYPPINSGEPPSVKLTNRPYKNGPYDQLTKSSYWFDWGYVPAGQNRREPLLSPTFAKKEDLPKWIYMIAPEWDLLRLEAQDKIHDLADTKVQGVEERAKDFQNGTYKWTLVKGATHGFTHHFQATAARAIKRRQKAEVVYEEAWKWLESGPLADK